MQPRFSPFEQSDQLRYLLAFVMLTTLAGLGVGVARIATSLYAVELEASALQIGLIASAQSVGILFMSLPVGILVHRYGPLRLFAFGTTMGGLVYAATPLVRDATYLLACTAAVSFFMPFRFVSLNSVFLRQLERLGPLRAGWFRGTHMTGFFLLGPLVSISLVQFLGYFATFQVVALTFLATILFAPGVLGGGPQRDVDAPSLNWSEIAGQLALLRTDGELRRASVVEFFSQAAIAYFGFFIVVIAIRDYGFSEASAGALMTTQGAVFVFALFTLGTLFNRIGQLPYFRISLALCAISLAMLAHHGATIILWVGTILLGLGLGMLHIANFLLYARIGRRLGMGRVSGLTALVGPSGGLVGGLIGGWIGQFWGLQALFLPMAVIFAWLVADIGKLATLEPEPVLATTLLTEMEGKS